MIRANTRQSEKKSKEKSKESRSGENRKVGNSDVILLGNPAPTDPLLRQNNLENSIFFFFFSSACLLTASCPTRYSHSTFSHHPTSALLTVHVCALRSSNCTFQLGIRLLLRETGADCINRNDFTYKRIGIDKRTCQLREIK